MKARKNGSVLAQQYQRSTARAKRVLLEILRQAGEHGLGKTHIFKAFWLAHLYYAKDSPGYLTDWPIVRMPWGPGIDRGEKLLVELVHNKDLHVTHLPKGPFTETNYRIAKQAKADNLSADAMKAIKQAVKDATRHTAKSLSELSHEFCRSWRQAADGEELDIYTDLVPDDVYEERREELEKLNKIYDKLTK
jgi:hypothetical protein